VIAHVAEEGDYLRVFIRGISEPLYWPRHLPMYDLHKVLTECFYPDDWHFYEVPETRVRDGDHVVDCGAAEGVFSLRVLARAGRITLFEPLRLFTESLKRTFQDHTNVCVVNAALSNAEGAGVLQGGSLYGVVRADGEGEAISITTLDAWLNKSGARLDFLKADLEGFEERMLEGASTSIARWRPRIAITVYHPGNDWKTMQARLRELVPSYKFRVKGLSYNDRVARPVMLHCWVDE